MTPDITSPIDQEFEHYLPLLEKFAAMPRSLRLFEEVHALSSMLLDKYEGKKQYGGENNKCTELIGSTRRVALQLNPPLIFSPPQSDYLSIKDDYRTQFGLWRQRGYQLKKQLDRLDDLENMLRGPTFMEILRGWRQFQPYSLDITNLLTGEKKKIQY